MVNLSVEDTASDHSHAPSASRSIASKTVDTIKKRAKQSDEVTSTIIQNCISEFPLESLGALPTKGTLSRMVRRQLSAPDGDQLNEDMKFTI